MTDPAASDNGAPPLRLKALPDGSLSETQIEALREGDAFDVVAPIVVDTATGRVTHLDLTVDDTYFFLGWNPDDECWERILTVVDEGDKSIQVSAISIVDDETGESEFQFEPGADPDVKELTEFVWEYVEHTYTDTDRLFDIMDEALTELSSDE
jgi:hypothetical protein